MPAETKDRLDFVRGDRRVLDRFERFASVERFASLDLVRARVVFPVFLDLFDIDFAFFGRRDLGIFYYVNKNENTIFIFLPNHLSPRFRNAFSRFTPCPSA